MSLKLLSHSLWDFLNHLQKKSPQKTKYRKPHVAQQLLLRNQAVGGIPVARIRQRSMLQTSNWMHLISCDE